MLLLAMPGVAAAKAAMPHFKWGQSKETIFLSVMVRDLDKSSVVVSVPTDGDLSFRAKDVKGDAFALDLPLREDVKADVMKWEISPRSDKWGIPVVISLGKRNEHRWDVLVPEPKKFKGLIDKDWTREDQSLEPEEEPAYAEDHSAYLVSVTEKNLNKTLAKFGTVIANVRYPWCSQCKSQDDTFAKAAKVSKAKSKKDKKGNAVAFAVIDAREERYLARWLGAKCDYTCEYKVFAEPGEEPLTMKSKWSEEELLRDVVKYLTPAVRVLNESKEADTLKEKNTTCVGSFVSQASPKYALFKRVAGLMRGELVFAAAFGEDKPLELWPQGQSFSFKYEGMWEDNGTALFDWVRPRSIPLLQEYDWQLRETYEKLNLPLAKVWINDEDKNPSFEKIVRHAVRRVAKRYIGQIAFVEQKKSTYSYELRDYGLSQPEAYPAFGIAGNASYNSVKYGFEITEAVAPSVQDFWRDADKAAEKLEAFCDAVLAGTWPEAHESGPLQTNWTEGMVRQLAWKSYAEIESPERPLLLEVFGKYRGDNEKKLKEAENLATALQPYATAFTVASYDTAENYKPDVFKRDKYSSDTEWFWVPTKGAGESERGPMKQLMKPKKDAPIKKVIEFVKKMSGSDIDVDATMSKFEELMKENPPQIPTPQPGMGDGDMDDMGGMEGMEGLEGIPGMGNMEAKEEL